MQAKGPLTPFHGTEKVGVTFDGKEALFLNQDGGAITMEPQSDYVDAQQGLYGDVEFVITRTWLLKLTCKFRGTSPTLRDVKPVLAEKTLEAEGYPVEVTDINETSKMGASCDKAALLQLLNKTRGGPSLNEEEIVSIGAFMVN